MLEFVLLLRKPIELGATSQLPIRIMKYSLVIVQVLRTFSVAAVFQLFAGKENQSNRHLLGLWQNHISPCFTQLFCLSSCGGVHEVCKSGNHF